MDEPNETVLIMRKAAYTATIAVIVLTVVNLIGGLINKANGLYPQTDVVPFIFVLHLICGGLYVVSCRPKWRLRPSMRWPLARTAYMLLVVYEYEWGTMLKQNNWRPSIEHVASFDFLGLHTLSNYLYQADLGWVSTWSFQFYVIYILGISVYHILVLEGANWLAGRLLKRSASI